MSPRTHSTVVRGWNFTPGWEQPFQTDPASCLPGARPGAQRATQDPLPCAGPARPGAGGAEVPGQAPGVASPLLHAPGREGAVSWSGALEAHWRLQRSHWSVDLLFLGGVGAVPESHSVFFVSCPQVCDKH